MNTGTGGKPHIITVTLHRDGFRQPWGIRVTGGADLGTPLTITRAQVGSPSEGELKRGDIIKKIADYDARDLSHADAQTLFQNAGNTISLVVQRQTGAAMSSGSATLPRSHTQPLPSYIPSGAVSSNPVKPPVAGGVATPFALAAARPERPATPGAAAPRKNEQTVVFPPPLPGWGTDGNEEAINNQPYRTTPLVLPGAKVKKDSLQTESYLRHHPNPSFRAPPHANTTAEVLMKQKVVHKQFNSPIGLYSDQNIVDTIQSQTGVTPSRTSTLDRRNQVPVSLKKTYVYDPAKSETFKALKEAELGDTIQEVTVPVQPKVFEPSKGATFKKQAPVQHQTFVNSLGNYEDKIQQSGSFRRLMNQVLGESEY
ncbi:PDZ and LIM domain protein 3 isoform X2 [Anabrus simplex]|uniref:PDZ and LIM domain protein 3 isoform X2 n=1 Tax=Anabrus simplex TaxID=316456 RepID=UPI0034DD7930